MSKRYDTSLEVASFIFAPRVSLHNNIKKYGEVSYLLNGKK